MHASGFALTAPQTPFARIDLELAVGPADAVVEVAGCGLCHTDIGFVRGEVPTRAPLPLVLGHEISGVVVEAGEAFAHWVGARVIVPAVMPCGDCPNCLAGCPNTCKRQVMPGNDVHGGFATHLRVPARHLAVLPAELGGYELSELSVIADAVTTPYQSVLRAGVRPGDVAIVIGVGGVGTYGVQLARAFGARVVAVDIDEARLAAVAPYGADATVHTAGLDLKAARAAVKAAVARISDADFGWKIFEMSGSRSGQELAYNLIPPSGTLAIVGFTMARLELRLSNLMAFDATCFGNWGCAPEHYPEAIRMVLEGRVDLKPFIRRHPLSDIQALFDAAHHGGLAERAILVP